MEHPCSPQDKSDSVPLSSSPAPSSGSECEVTGSAHLSLPPNTPPTVPSLENPSVQVSRLGDNFCVEKASEIPDGPSLALLSPFAIAKKDPLPECFATQSAKFQHVIQSNPSPSIPRLSSGSEVRASPFVSNVLQSPFGVHLRSASSVPDDLFVSSPPRMLAPSIEPVSTDNKELGGVGLVGCEDRKDGNTPSDSGEDITGTPVTSRTEKYSSGVTTSSPYYVGGIIENHASKQVTVCGDVGYVHQKDDMTTPPNPEVKSPVLNCVDSTVTEGPSSTQTPRSMSPKASSSFASPTSGLLGRKGPPDKTQLEARPMDHPSPLKRSREADDKEPSAAPKRMTLASQQRQHKKLASPFRSPLITMPNLENVSTPDRGSRGISHPFSGSTLQRDSASPIKKVTSNMQHSGTPLSSSVKAKAPFKSPLVTSSPMVTPLRISNTRTIQDLEHKIQLLKRAIKIKQEGDKEKLEELIKKWREAGREGAWELWRIVRDSEETTEVPYPGTNSKSFGSPFDGSWGWAGSSSSTHENSWGWDERSERMAQGDDVRSEELESPTKVERELFDTLRKGPIVPRRTMLPPTPRGAYFEQANIALASERFGEEARADHGEGSQELGAPGPSKTLGTMLHQLGIAHETLGWVEEEGDFVDT